jgi:hypothetical protein
MARRAWLLLAVWSAFHCSCWNSTAANLAIESVGKAEVSFSQSAASVECYDFIEITLNVAKTSIKNPFTDASVLGHFRLTGERNNTVEGFCDSSDGSVYRVRFMPSQVGLYEFSITYRQEESEKTYSGRFTAVDGKRRGLVRADPKHRWHFLWKGTGEHYFLNGSTAYLLLGWDDEKIIRDCIARFHRLEVNRLRVLLDGRTDHFWTEPIKPGNSFRARLNPWLSERPDDIYKPRFDYTRFNCPYWQKFERMLRDARDKDMIISVIFTWNDTSVHPAAGSHDERRYFRYAVNRLAAFSNVAWDLGDDLDSFRSDDWTHETGMWLFDSDIYHHLATSHPVRNQHQDRTSLWFGMTSFQIWSRPLHEWMLDQRRQQAATTRIIPQVNEEYGYEDHYPRWAKFGPPAASADGMRRMAWEIAMAGCYQTTGETAKRGTGIAPDSGGGWVNGRGDASMTMLDGYARMVRFFTKLEWWKTEPHDEYVDNGAFCLADPGKLYVVYLPHGGEVAVKLEPGPYQAQWYNPRTGEYLPESKTEGPGWTSPTAIPNDDWVLLLKRSSTVQ